MSILGRMAEVVLSRSTGPFRSLTYLDLAQPHGLECHLQAPPTMQPLAHIAGGRHHWPQSLLPDGVPTISSKDMHGSLLSTYV